MAKTKETKKDDKKAASAAPAPKGSPENVGQVQGMNLHILAQYLRDASFENPNAPQSLRAELPAPKTDISFHLDARDVQGAKASDLFEVVLKVTINATRDEKPVFIAEAEYGALVVLKDVPEDKRHPLLLIEVPRLLFPFLRQVIADMTQEGGFPPLVLNPVDFTRLYIQRFAPKDGK
ncbi:MAG: protein-export chaperone SecB [Pseudobdellovibrionaceae bacterium]